MVSICCEEVILDPQYTFSVSKKQTAAGCADLMNQTMEQYFAADTTLLSDGFCESMLRSRVCWCQPPAAEA
ncbi:MAG: iron-containing alcohol dehydrogenase [Bacteroidaceae bacterium]|nr:iron-containing alcohol dehydrogenase [Bacteroidaceae bacterium]